MNRKLFWFGLAAASAVGCVGDDPLSLLPGTAGDPWEEGRARLDLSHTMAAME